MVLEPAHIDEYHAPMSDKSTADRTSQSCRFQVWHDTYSRRLRARARSKIFSEDDAEQLLQDFWMRVYRSMDKFNQKDGVEVSSWLFKILNNMIIDFYRKQSRQLQMSSAGLETVMTRPKESPDEERLLAFRECVKRLNDTLHSVFHLILVEEKSSSEVAELLGLKTEIVYQRNCRAKEAIRECVQQKLKA